MPRVRIVQLLCPQRHCIVATAYESPDGQPIEDMRTRLLEFFEALRRAGANDWCGICHARNFTAEDAATGFDSMTEAAPYLAVSAAYQMGTRQFFRAARN